MWHGIARDRNNSQNRMWGLGKSVKIKYGSGKPVFKLKTGVFVEIFGIVLRKPERQTWTEGKMLKNSFVQ